MIYDPNSYLFKSFLHQKAGVAAQAQAQAHQVR